MERTNGDRANGWGRCERVGRRNSGWRRAWAGERERVRRARMGGTARVGAEGVNGWVARVGAKGAEG